MANDGGEAADSIAGIVMNLASLYTRTQQPARAVALIERLLASREKAINHHLLDLLAAEHATALHALGRTDDAIAAYHGDGENKLQKQRTRYQ